MIYKYNKTCELITTKKLFDGVIEKDQIIFKRAYKCYLQPECWSTFFDIKFAYVNINPA